MQMGTYLEESGDLKAALDEYRAAIESDRSSQQPGRASAYYKAARLSKKLGYSEEAAQDFKTFNQIHEKTSK